ncbi:MAG: hypothetical protein ACJ8AD_04080 [Gemmatimonadaceae bacterium]
MFVTRNVAELDSPVVMVTALASADTCACGGGGEFTVTLLVAELNVVVPFFTASVMLPVPGVLAPVKETSMFTTSPTAMNAPAGNAPAQLTLPVQPVIAKFTLTATVPRFFAWKRTLPF